MSRISMLRDDDIIIDVNKSKKEAEISELYNILFDLSLRVFLTGGECGAVRHCAECADI